MREPGARGARFQLSAATVLEGSSKGGIKEDSRTFGTHGQLDLARLILSSDIQPAATDQRIPGKHRQV